LLASEADTAYSALEQQTRMTIRSAWVLVTFYGRVDSDLCELATIEASSVHIKNLDTHFRARSTDEEGDASDS